MRGERGIVVDASKYLQYYKLSKYINNELHRGEKSSLGYSLKESYNMKYVSIAHSTIQLKNVQQIFIKCL